MDVRTVAMLKDYLEVRKTQSEKAVQAGFQGAVTRSAKHLEAVDREIFSMFLSAGLEEQHLSKDRAANLPGHFREYKSWDVLAHCDHRLVGAVELKSQSGSIGNNMNNRIEEALGSGYDSRSAQEVSNLYGDTGLWLGYVFILVRSEDTQKKPQRRGVQHLVPDSIFKDKNYEERYKIAIQRMLDRKLYDAAWYLVVTVNEDSGEVSYEEPLPLATREVFETRLNSRVQEFFQAVQHVEEQ